MAKSTQSRSTKNNTQPNTEALKEDKLERSDAEATETVNEEVDTASDVAETEPTETAETDDGTDAPVTPVKEEATDTTPADDGSASFLTDLGNNLANYGRLMSPYVSYSTLNGPRNQLLLIAIYESVFEQTTDYEVLKKKIVFLLNYVLKLRKSRDNYLADDLIHRGFDDIPTTPKRRENFSRLATMISRLADPATRKEEFSMLDLNFTFEASGRPDNVEQCVNAISELCA